MLAAVKGRAFDADKPSLIYALRVWKTPSSAVERWRALTVRWLKNQIAPDFGEIVSLRLHELKVEAATKKAKRTYTQREVAKRIGMKSAGCVSRITTGRRITLLRPHQFWLLGEVLGFTPEVMLEAAGYLTSEQVNAHGNSKVRKEGKLIARMLVPVNPRRSEATKRIARKVAARMRYKERRK